MHENGSEPATERESGRAQALWVVVGRTRIRHIIAGPGSELSGEENPLEFERHRTWLDRNHGPVCSSQHLWIQNRPFIAHEADSKVANCFSAKRFLSQTQV